MSLPGPWGWLLPSKEGHKPIPNWQMNIGAAIILPPMIVLMIILDLTGKLKRHE